MAVLEVSNSEFARKDVLEGRKRKRIRKSAAYRDTSPLKIDSIGMEKRKAFSLASMQETKEKHKAYREFLANRKNGERSSSLNYLK